MESVTPTSAYVSPVVQLSPDKQELCGHTLRFLNDLGPIVQKVAECGIDCSNYEALRQHLISVNQKIHKNFCGPPKLLV
jgi:hypothetical protein